MQRPALSPKAPRRNAKPKPAANRARPSPTSQNALTIEGKELRVSHLEKVLYPKCGFTKGQVIDYYIRVAPALLPHLRDRPLTMKRYPNGVDGAFFYEKRCPDYRPPWIKTTAMWSEQNQADIHFCTVNNLASLVWAANLADLELHTYLCRSGKPDSPTMVVFDLDPGPPANIIQCSEVALLLKEQLDQQQLESFPKTSGSKGLQVFVPLNTKTTYEKTKQFARGMAENLARQHPNLILSKMERVLRAGKVFIDWSQNDRHKTTVCAYSLRAKDRPTVSTPVTWNEVRQALKKADPDQLSFVSDQVLKRVESLGDLFQPVIELKQKIPRL